MSLLVKAALAGTALSPPAWVALASFTVIGAGTAGALLGSGVLCLTYPLLAPGPYLGLMGMTGLLRSRRPKDD